ncbi:MAG: DUF3347 domain-containing protein [Pyrinomonadaceae bacterium]
MKIVKAIAVIFAIGFAISTHAQDLGVVDPAVKSQIGTVLTQYYGVKDALVASDAAKASTNAGEIVTSLEAVDLTKMTDQQKTQWGKLNALIRTDAVHINRNKELEHQREHFAKLSGSVYAMVASFKVNTSEAYLHYCPMKKASWLSDSKEVKNPYFGSKMLTCGSVKATLKKN